MSQRRGVGHLQFYTKDLALETLTECGYTIDEWRYTGGVQNPGHAPFLEDPDGCSSQTSRIRDQ